MPDQLNRSTCILCPFGCECDPQAISLWLGRLDYGGHVNDGATFRPLQGILIQ